MACRKVGIECGYTELFVWSRVFVALTTTLVIIHSLILTDMYLSLSRYLTLHLSISSLCSAWNRHWTLLFPTFLSYKILWIHSILQILPIRMNTVFLFHRQKRGPALRDRGLTWRSEIFAGIKSSRPRNLCFFRISSELISQTEAAPLCA